MSQTNIQRLSLLLCLALAFLGTIAELIFINVFRSLFEGNYSNFNPIYLIAATAAPILYIGYNLYAYGTSLSISNYILGRIIDSGIKESKQSEVKIVLEDFHLFHESFLNPILLIAYRLAVSLTLITFGLILLLQEFGPIVFAFVLIGALVVAILQKVFGKLSVKFSKLQDQRMRLGKEIADQQDNQRKSSRQIEEFHNINKSVYWTKRYVFLVGSFGRPVFDLFILLSIAGFYFAGFTLEEDLGFVGTLAVMGYRLLAPSINLVHSAYQVQFGWLSISDEWRYRAKRTFKKLFVVKEPT